MSDLLCAGIDPGSRSGIACVTCAIRPRLLVLRLIESKDPDEWASLAYQAFDAIVCKATARGCRVVGWYEMTVPMSENGWKSACDLSMTRGQLLGHASDAGLKLADWDEVYQASWTSRLGVHAGKRGDGTHRIAEAERLVECDPTTFRGLGDGAVDCAESVLIAVARAWAELGIRRCRLALPAIFCVGASEQPAPLRFFHGEIVRGEGKQTRCVLCGEAVVAKRARGRAA